MFHIFDCARQVKDEKEFKKNSILNNATIRWSTMHELGPTHAHSMSFFGPKTSASCTLQVLQQVGQENLKNALPIGRTMMEAQPISINVGSRKSQLALIQTNTVVEKLGLFYENNPDSLEQLFNLKSGSTNGLKFNIKSMTTTGDNVLDRPLVQIGTKSLFTRELEVELLQGRVDIVVHSLKDLPTTLPEGCAIGAVIKRDDPNDAIVLKKSLRSQFNSLDLLFKGTSVTNCKESKIGTSSQRRIAMIKRVNPNLECIDIRGNLNTRIVKLDKEDSEYAAIILAKAGLDRMGWSNLATGLLTPEQDPRLADWSYAVGQGAIAVECRSNDQLILELLRPISDLKTTLEVIAERSLMKKLEGGCSVPLGVRSTWADGNDGQKLLNLFSIVLSSDGKEVVKADDEATLLWEQVNQEATSESHELDSKQQTTGITLSNKALSELNVKRDMIECANLGIKVANKMIDSKCLRLMNRAK